MSGLVLLAVSLVVGLAAAAAIRPRDAGPAGDAALVRVIGLALGLGLAATWGAAALLRPGLAPGASLGTDVGCAVAALLALAAWRRRAAARGDAPPSAPVPRPARVPVPVVALLSFGIACALVLVVMRLLHRPDGDWDAFAFWNLRARLLHRAGGDVAVVFRSAAAGDHPDYPLFLSGLVATGWSIAGEGSTAVTGVVAVLFGALAAAGLHAAVGARRGGVAAAIAVLALLAYRQVPNSVASRYADVPLSALLLLACGALASAVERPARARSALALAGLCASLAAWTKNEGAVHVIAVALTALVRPPAGLSRRGALGACVAGAAPFLAVLLAFKFGLAPRNDLVEGTTAAGAFARATDPSRYATIARHLLGEWTPTAYGRFLFPLTLLLVVAGPRRRAGDGPVATVLCLVALAYAAVYVLTPQPLDWHLTWSLDRLLVHLYPSLLLAAALRLVPPPARDVAAPAAPSSPSPAPSPSPS